MAQAALSPCSATRLARAHPEAFPRAAKANRSLFFDRKEAARAKAKPLSVAEVQGRVGAMIDNRVARYVSVKTELASAQVTSQQVP